MNASNVDVVDVLVGIALLFSIYVLVQTNGWVKGFIYLGVLLFIGVVLALVSVFFNDAWKLGIAAVLLAIGLIKSLDKG